MLVNKQDEMTMSFNIPISNEFQAIYFGDYLYSVLCNLIQDHINLAERIDSEKSLKKFIPWEVKKND